MSIGAKRATISFMKSPTIAASILSADFAKLGEEAQNVLNAGAHMIHFDVMDNHYVPNLTIGPMVCKALRNYGIKAPIDVHLMVKPVDNLIPAFAKAGASIITVHPESTEHLDRTLSLIKEHGCLAGLAFNPATPLNVLEYVGNKVDLVLIMSVNPGFGGQQFIESSLDKIREARDIIDDLGFGCQIEVDGGIKPSNIADVANAGAEIFVAGSAIFGSDNYAKTISEMLGAVMPSSKH